MEQDTHGHAVRDMTKEPYGEQDTHWLKKTVLFLSSQTLSLFGSAMVQFAIIWYVTLATGSGGMMTIATVCSFVPQLIISIFAGVWADRYNRKLLIVAADGMIALITLILAVVFISGNGQMWMVFIVSAIRSLGAGIQTPAVSSIIPQFVPKDKLMKINGLNSSINAVIMLAAPAASGALLSFAGLEATFFVDVFTALAAIVIMLTLKLEAQERQSGGKRGGYFEDLKAGVKYVAGHPFVRMMIVFSALCTFFISPAALLTPLLVKRSFAGDEWRLALNEMLFSGGAILGGVLISLWGGFKNRIHTIALASMLFGVFTVAMGFASYFSLFLAAVAAAGITMPMINSTSISMLQERVEPAMQGRVFGFFGIISSTVLPLGMLIFGPLADLYSVELLLVVTGIILAVLGFIMTRYSKLGVAPQSA